jgi:lipopolysaccharide export LptBFGC system permease protein LptF
MDTIGEILWIAMFFTPLVTVPLVLRFNTSNAKGMRMLIGLLLAFIISFIFFIIGFSILFRDGLGPT